MERRGRVSVGYGSMRILEHLLTAIGYVIAPVLFLRAETPTAVAKRLRLAYRLVGVDIVETPTVDDRERTVFLCPYRHLGEGRWGAKWLCHQKLDRVDDGYVKYLDRHRDITYVRPQSCEQLVHVEDRFCFSEVSER